MVAARRKSDLKSKDDGARRPPENADESAPRVGEYFVDYSEATREELDATDPEMEKVLARSKIISTKGDL